MLALCDRFVRCLVGLIICLIMGVNVYLVTLYVVSKWEHVLANVWY